MKKLPMNLHKNLWMSVLGVVSLLCVILASGCTITSTPSITATSIPPTATITSTSTVIPSTPTPTTTSTQTAIPMTLASMAEDVSIDVGQVMTIVESDPQKIIFVFEETHDSPAGQIEIAVMLNRLYENYDLRQIGLEGALPAGGPLDASWLQFSPPFRARDPIRAREDVIVQLLEDGEISGAEMMALVYDDVEVIGIDDKDLYAIPFPEEASFITTVYLYLTAIPGLTDSEITEANNLIDQEEILEAVEFIISTDPYTDEMYNRINDESIIISDKEWVEILGEIETKAIESGAELEPEDEAAMDALQEFFQATYQRSDALASNAINLVEAHPAAPLAMMIGAAHTERVSELLTEAGISFVVLRANSLAERREEGDLSFEAYDRKMLGLSVDPAGSLGFLLDGRKKPQPVLGETWLQVKGKFLYIVTLAAHAIADGHTMGELDSLLPTFEEMTFRALEMDGNELIFAIDTIDNNRNPITIYGRTVVDKPAAERQTDKMLEERLFDGLGNVRDRKAPDPGVEEPGPESVSEPTVTRISSDTIVIFSKDRGAIEASRLSD